MKETMDEAKLIALYMEIAGVSESQARSVYMFLELVAARSSPGENNAS
jgi:hypothetical protein